MGCGATKTAAQEDVIRSSKVRDAHQDGARKQNDNSGAAATRRPSITGANANAAPKSKVVANGAAISSEGKSRGNVTFIQWLNTAFPAVNADGDLFVQNALPGYYTEITPSFANVDATPDQLNQIVTLTKKVRSNENGSTKLAHWPYRKPKTSAYSSPPDTYTVEVSIPADSTKRRIVVLGNAYFGSGACTERTRAFLNGRLEQLLASAHSDLHSVVLLGNIVDTRIDTFGDVPSTSQQLEERWQRDGGYSFTLIRQLSEQCAVSVYYVRGTHDGDVGRSVIERLLGSTVVVVPGDNLVYVIRELSETYTVRFSSGYEYDILESGLSAPLKGDDLLLGKPIAHYLYRAAAAACARGVGLEYTPLSAVRSFLEDVPNNVNEKMVAQLSTRTAQRMITEHLLTHAFRARSYDSVKNLKYVVDEGKYISSDTILNYPYLKFKLTKWQPGEMAGALQANGGDYCMAAKKAQEDVVLYGHANVWQIGTSRSHAGRDVIYAVIGGCSERAESLTMLSIIAPRLGRNGKVEVTCDNDVFTTKDEEPQQEPTAVEETVKHGNINGTEIRIETVD